MVTLRPLVCAVLTLTLLGIYHPAFAFEDSDNELVYDKEAFKKAFDALTADREAIIRNLGVSSEDVTSELEGAPNGETFISNDATLNPNDAANYTNDATKNTNNATPHPNDAKIYPNDATRHPNTTASNPSPH